jgi:hypothetical protein
VTTQIATVELHGAPTTLVVRSFADAVHVLVTTLAKPGCLVTPTRTLLHSRDSPAAALMARQLRIALAKLGDERDVFLSLALHTPLFAAADGDNDVDPVHLARSLAPFVEQCLSLIAHANAPPLLEQQQQQQQQQCQ